YQVVSMFIITPRQRTTHGLPGAPWEDRKQPASGATALHGLLLCFSFFWRGAAETRCSCCQGAGLLVCAGGAKTAQATPPGRVWALRAGPRASASARRTFAGGAAAGGVRPAAVANLR